MTQTVSYVRYTYTQTVLINFIEGGIHNMATSEMMFFLLICQFVTFTQKEHSLLLRVCQSKYTVSKWNCVLYDFLIYLILRSLIYVHIFYLTALTAPLPFQHNTVQIPFKLSIYVCFTLEGNGIFPALIFIG